MVKTASSNELTVCCYFLSTSCQYSRQLLFMLHHQNNMFVFRGMIALFNERFHSPLFLCLSNINVGAIFVLFIFRDNWNPDGLQKGEFDRIIRPHLPQFKTDHDSRLYAQQSTKKCNSCYAVWKNNNDLSRRDILEQVNRHFFL